MTTDIKPTLFEHIEVRKRFLRSVNLEKDYETESHNGEYIITPITRQIIRRVSEGLEKDSTYRAWTVTGPYGVGKSAFAVFLTKLLCHQPTEERDAWDQLDKVDPALAKELAARGHGSNGKKGMLPILLTARRTSAALCLLEGIQSAICQVGGEHTVVLAEQTKSLLSDAEKNASTDSRAIASLVDLLAKAAQRAGYSGLLLLVDEFGKLFEFAARTPQKGDVFVLQEIAERASRSGGFPILFLGFLHQSFDEYGQHLDSLTRREWAKVHGRFEDIAFLEPAEQVIRMIAGAIKWKSGNLPSGLIGKIVQIAKDSIKCGICPSGMKEAEFEEVCLHAYPLHPVTLVTLPFLFRRFAQNERSMFSYLSSLEPGGFQEFLRTHTISDKEAFFLRLHHLFDYFTINLGAGLFRQPHARRWLEAADILDRKENLNDLHVKLVKTIGVLGAIGDFCNLSAQEKIISICLVDDYNPPAAVRESLLFIRDQSIITYRRYNNTYRIWEGSDIDIDERVAEGERKVRGCVNLANSIQRYVETRPLVARRHAFETGALRHFDVVYLDDPDHISKYEASNSGAVGQVCVCLSTSPMQIDAYRQLAVDVMANRLEVVIAIPQWMGDINSAIMELAALRWAWDNTPELRDDRVARREIVLRITESEHFIRRNLDTLLDPRAEPLGGECLWYWNGMLQTMRSRTGISYLLSNVCDRLYSETPRVRNELITRRSLSSAAAAARRNLVERMLTQSDKPFLGMDGYPPERSMYESVLKATGLHREMEPGLWCFAPPHKDARSNLWPVWQTLSDMVFQTQPVPQPLDRVFKRLSEPPYGVMDGLHPVFLIAFMMVHKDEITLYREETFIPEPGMAEFEILMRRPELFGIAGSRVAGIRAAVVDRFAKGMGVKPTTVPVVRALFGMVKQFPEFAWRTSRVSTATMRMREAFEKAKSPERFLYVDLPDALGLPCFSEDQTDVPQIETFFDMLNSNLREWSGAMHRIIDEAKQTLLKACALEPVAQGWEQLREIAAKLESRESDPVLLQFVKRVVQSGSDETGICSVLSLVANRPIANWADSDVERFPHIAKGIGDGIRRAVVRYGPMGESNHAMSVLTPEERERARCLAQELEEKVIVLGQANEKAVLRAALLWLVDKMDYKGSG